MNTENKCQIRSWCEKGEILFFVLIAEMDLVVKKLINIFFARLRLVCCRGPSVNPGWHSLFFHDSAPIMHIIADGFGQNILPEERGPWNFVHLLCFFPIGKPISKCTKFKMATANKDAFIDKPHRFQTLLNRDCNDRPSQTPDTSVSRLFIFCRVFAYIHPRALRQDTDRSYNEDPILLR